MIKVFTVKCGVLGYMRLGRKYPFLKAPFMRCHKCGKLVKFKKHGFYERYFLCSIFNGRIIIRRYRCPVCGVTISMIPSFCLPGYTHGLEHVFEYIYSAFYRRGTLNACIQELNTEFNLHISRQLLYHYRKRFMANITLIKIGIRQLKHNISFLDTSDKKERAKEILNIVRNWPGKINSFSQQFTNVNNQTFLALSKLL